MTIGTKIKQLRKKKAMFSYEVAEKLKVSPQTVVNWENNYKQPSLKHIRSLASLFGVEITELTKHL